MIILSILINSILLAVDGSYLSSESVTILDLMHVIFYFIFVVEMLLKLTGYGFKYYFMDKFNILDFIVVAATSASTVLFFTNQ